MSQLRLLTTLLTFTLMLIAPVSTEDNQEDCPQGSYRTETNICCYLCPAGTHKSHECTTHGQFPVCLSCIDKSTFTDSANNLTSCQACKICDKSELFERQCSTISDTVCTCIKGLHRPSPSQACEDIEGSKGWIWAIVPVVMVTVAGFVGLVIWMKKLQGQRSRRPYKDNEAEMQLLHSDDHSMPTPVEPQVTTPTATPRHHRPHDCHSEQRCSE